MELEAPRGQERARALLRAALRTGAVAQAYLFVGPSGVGRARLARSFARELLCAAPKEGQACGACKSCRAFDRGSHPDYREGGVPEGKQELPIELVRQLQHEASLKPVLSRRRVFVVRDAERMTMEAANCFLKTLEEPPGRACFILIASSLWQTPATVVSRCRIVRMAPLPLEQVEEELRSAGLGPEQARWLAWRSWGSIGRAREFAALGLQEFNARLAEQLCALGPGDEPGLADWVAAAPVGQQGARSRKREVLQELVECVAVFYRDLALSILAGQRGELFNKGMEGRFRDLAARVPLDCAIECADKALHTIERLGANANARLALDDLFSELAGSVAKGEQAAGGPEADPEGS